MTEILLTGILSLNSISQNGTCETVELLIQHAHLFILSFSAIFFNNETFSGVTVVISFAFRKKRQLLIIKGVKFWYLIINFHEHFLRFYLFF